MEFLPLLLLHASILEPDLHLSFVESERGGDLDAARSGQVAVEVELLLELGQLLVGEVGAAEVRLMRIEMMVMMVMSAEMMM